MAKMKTKMVINNSAYKKIYDNIDSKIESVMKVAIDDIEKRYCKLIYRFYTEYEPKRYYRHKDLFAKSFSGSFSEIPKTGLGKTYSKYYKKYIGKGYVKYVGGIRIRPDGMYDDYGTPPSLSNKYFAYESWMSGYHGNVTKFGLKPINSSVHPRVDMQDEKRKAVSAANSNLRKALKSKNIRFR